MDIHKKAEYAKQILGNPVYSEMLLKVEQDIIIKWKSSLVKGKEYREELFYEYEALRKIDNALRGIINNAIYAKQIEADREALK